jgi:hypothetical protein
VTEKRKSPKLPVAVSAFQQDAERWAEWIEASVRAELFQGKGASAYGEFAAQVMSGESTSDGLRLVANSMGDNGQEIFAAACPRIIEHLSFSSDADLRVAAIVLELSRYMGSIAVLRELARKSHLYPVETWPSSFFQTALEFARLSSGRDGARSAELIYHMVRSSKNFPSHQSFRTLVALSEAVPESLSDHFILLRKHLNSILGSDEGSIGAAEENRRLELRVELLRQLDQRVPNKASFALSSFSSRGTEATPQWWLDTIAQTCDLTHISQAISKELKLERAFQPLTISDRSAVQTLQPRVPKDNFRFKNRTASSLRAKDWLQRSGLSVKRLLRLETSSTSGDAQ